MDGILQRVRFDLTVKMVEIQPNSIITFKVAEGEVEVDTATFLHVAAALNWNKIEVIRMLRLLRFDNGLIMLSLRSSKDITEFMFDWFRPDTN